MTPLTVTKCHFPEGKQQEEERKRRAVVDMQDLQQRNHEVWDGKRLKIRNAVTSTLMEFMELSSFSFLFSQSLPQLSNVTIFRQQMIGNDTSVSLLRWHLLFFPDYCCLLSNILSFYDFRSGCNFQPFTSIMKRPSLFILIHHLHSSLVKRNGLKPISSYTLYSESSVSFSSFPKCDYVYTEFDTFTEICLFLFLWQLQGEVGFSLELLTRFAPLLIPWLLVLSLPLFHTLHIQKSNTFTLICSTSSYWTIFTPSTPFTHHL